MTKDKIIEFYKNHKVIINCILAWSLFCVSCFGWFMCIPAYIVLIAGIIFSNDKDTLTYFLVGLPFFHIGGTCSFIMFGIHSAIFMIKFMLKSIIVDKIRFPKWHLIMIALVTVFCLLPFNEYNSGYFIKLALMIVVLLFMSILVQNTKMIHYSYHLRMLTLSIIASCIFGLLYFVSPYMQSSFEVIYEFEHVIRFQGMFKQPNTLAIFAEILLGLWAYEIMTDTENKKFKYVAFCEVSMIGFLTISKTFFIMFGVILLSLFIWSIIKKNKPIIITSITCIACVAVIVVIDIFLGGTILSRFDIGEVSSVSEFFNLITTGRTEIWAEYLNYTLSSPIKILFGSGLGAGVVNVMSPHNGFISCFYQFGILGIILFTAQFIVMLKSLDRKPSKSIWVILMVIALILMVEDGIFFLM